MGYNGTRYAACKPDDLPFVTCTPCDNRICGMVGAKGPAPRPRDLQRGERLEAGPCLKVWTVVEGLAALCTSLPDGRRQIVTLSTPGDLLCPMPGTQGADLWVEALTGTRLCELDLSASAEALGEDAALSAELFRVVHRQMTCASVHLITLGRLDGMERVCLFLTDMVWRLGVRGPAGWRVHLPLSREDIADYLGLNAETVSRIFSRVKKSKLATFLSPTDFFVQDVEALQSRAPLAAPHGPERLGAGQPEALVSCRT